MSVTALTLETTAYELIGVIQPGESLTPIQAQRGLEWLNRMLSTWAIQQTTVPVIDRQVFALTANVGNYTIGPGGDFDTSRPTTIAGAAVLLNNNQTPLALTSLTRAGTIATATRTNHGGSVGQWVTIAGATPAAFNGTFAIETVPTANTFTYTFGGATADASGTITMLLESNVANVTEIPCPLLTDDAWQAIQIKTLTSGLFTDVYYNPTFAGGLGTINLWPIPNTSQHALVLYRPMQLTSFPNLTQQVWLPEGAEDAIVYNLAFRLCAPNGVAVPADIEEMRRTSLGIYKRNNIKLNDMPLDAIWTQEKRGGYNIITGGYSGGGLR